MWGLRGSFLVVPIEGLGYKDPLKGFLKDVWFRAPFKGSLRGLGLRVPLRVWGLGFLQGFRVFSVEGLWLPEFRVYREL